LDIDGDDARREARGQPAKEGVHQLPFLIWLARTEHFASYGAVGIGPVDPPGILHMRNLAPALAGGKSLQLPRPHVPQQFSVKLSAKVLDDLKANHMKILAMRTPDPSQGDALCLSNRSARFRGRIALAAGCD
jgi:hypothetical protein